MATTLDTIIQTVLKLDNKLDLDSEEREIYQQTRFWLFRHIQHETDKSVSHRNESLKGSIMDIFYLIIALAQIIKGKLTQKPVVLISEHARLEGVQWKAGDPYFGVTEKELNRLGYSVITIGMVLGKKKYENELSGVIRIPRSIINGFRLFFRLINGNQPALIKKVIAKLKSIDSKIEINANSYANKVRQTRADNAFYKLLIAFIKPKLVICVDGYNSNSSLLRAAHIDSILSVEYQHGVVSQGHIGYTFGNKFEACERLLPTKYLLWGEVWKSELKNPIITSRIEVGTYEYGQWCLKSSKEIDKPEGVLFILQPSIMSSLTEKIREFVKKYPECKVGVKYHPKQNKIIENLAQVEHYLNSDLYELFMQYKYIVGCFSTALFEAAALNRLVFNIPLKEFQSYNNIMASAGILPIESFEQIFVKRTAKISGEDIISQKTNTDCLIELMNGSSH